MDTLLRLSRSKLVLLHILFLGILLTFGCQQETTTRDDLLSPHGINEALHEALAYSGRDSLILNTIDRLRSRPEAKGFALHMRLQEARPLWDKAIHVGWVNHKERLFIPLHQRGEEEITWIWVIYADRGEELVSEYLHRGECFEEHEWLFDYFTQEALGKRPKSGIIYRPSSSARMRIYSDGKFIYRCNVGFGSINNGPLRQISEERCVPIAELPRLRHIPAGEVGGDYGGGGYGYGGGGAGYGGNVAGMYWAKYNCLIWDRKGPPRTTPSRPPQDSSSRGPLIDTTTSVCGIYSLSIQRPGVKELLDQYHKLVQQLGGNEHGFIELDNGQTMQLKGDWRSVKLPDTIPSRRILGTVHTHPFTYEPPTESNPECRYTCQNFSPNDLGEYILRAQRVISSWVQQGDKGGLYDLRKIYTGLVTRRGMYVLTMDRVLNYKELSALEAKMSAQHIDSLNWERNPLKEKWNEAIVKHKGWYYETAEKLNNEILSLQSMPELEEKYILGLIAQYYTLADYNLSLLFYPLGVPNAPQGKKLHLDDNNALLSSPCK